VDERGRGGDLAEEVAQQVDAVAAVVHVAAAAALFRIDPPDALRPPLAPAAGEVHSYQRDAADRAAVEQLLDFTVARAEALVEDHAELNARFLAGSAHPLTL